MRECNWCGRIGRKQDSVCPDCGTSFPKQCKRTHDTANAVNNRADGESDIDSNGCYSNARKALEEL